MKLQQLRYYIAVYEEGSITAGAERANATQSGLSIQIKDLELQFKAPLFERFSSGVVPTEMGKRFYHHATRILHDVSEAEEEMKSLQGEMTGRVRAGLMPTFTRSILPPTLINFAKNYPLIETTILEAYSGQLVRDVANEILDFAIVPSQINKPEIGVRSHHIASDQEFLVSSANSEGEHLVPVDLATLGPLKLVLPSRENARRAKIDAYLHANGIELTAVLELDAMIGSIELVAQSDWKTILPGILCFADRDGAARKLNPIKAPLLNVDYVMIEPISRSLSPEASIFLKILEEELAREIDWHKF